MSSEQLNPGASNGQGNNNGSDADEQQRIDEEREHEQQLNADRRDQQDQRKRDDTVKDDRRADQDANAAVQAQDDERRDFDLAREDQLRRDDNRRDVIKKQDLDRLRRGAERAELVQPKESSASAGADRPGQPAGSAPKVESESNMFRKMPSYVAAGPGSLSAAQQASLAAGREAADREQMNREHANAQRELSRRIDLARDPRQRAQLQEQFEIAEAEHNDQRARWLESTEGGRSALGVEEVEFRRGVREETRQKLAARQEQLRKREEELGLRPAAQQQDTLQLEDKRDEQKGFEFKR